MDKVIYKLSTNDYYQGNYLSSSLSQMNGFFTYLFHLDVLGVDEILCAFNTLNQTSIIVGRLIILSPNGRVVYRHDNVKANKRKLQFNNYKSQFKFYLQQPGSYTIKYWMKADNYFKDPHYNMTLMSKNSQVNHLNCKQII